MHFNLIFFRFSDPIVLLHRIDNENLPISGLSENKSVIVKILVRKGNEGLRCNAPHSCCCCQKIFINRYSLKDHLETIHCKTTKMFCDLCPKFYFTKSTMIQHMIHAHRKKRFACNACDYKAATNPLLKKHKLTHAAKVECLFCKKLVTSGKSHKTVHKAKEMCSICCRMFSKCSMKRHMKTHNRIQYKKCSEMSRQKNYIKR